MIPLKLYRLLNGRGETVLSTIPGQYGGHRGRKIYGQLNCPSAIRWIQKGHYVKQRVFFLDEPTALQAGYRPCGVCLKSKYQAWKTNPKGFVEAGLRTLAFA
ncbi:MAG: metal-binding protein [Cyanobacteria bacterium]|nr:metal-binding protein [Cyanobacteriota bacterium]